MPQQFYLTGSGASDLAVRLFHALNVHPAGFRLRPFAVGGAMRGMALHLLLPPAFPLLNDVPCRISIAQGEDVTLTEPLCRLAVPGLRQALDACKPVLLDGLCADMLDCRPFRDAVAACLKSGQCVISVVSEDAVFLLRQLTPANTQLWMEVPSGDHPELLETLLGEVIMRLA